MQLEDFYDYKNQLMEDLLTTGSIVKLIDRDIDMKDAKNLAYKNVFPFEYVPDTVEQGKVFVCFDVDVSKSSGKTYLLPTIYVWVFAHQSLLRLPNGEGVRTDKLCSEICKKINGSRKYGLGELDLYSAKRFAPLTAYNGKCLTFFAKEFNRQYDGNKYTPTNRKSG